MASAHCRACPRPAARAIAAWQFLIVCNFRSKMCRQSARDKRIFNKVLYCVMFSLVHRTRGYHICVTGASGYLGSEIVYQLLQSGTNVRAVCRSVPAHLQAWKEFNGDRLAIFDNMDLAFGSLEQIDDALRGCDCVIHTAAPFPVSCAGIDVAGPTLAALHNTLAACTRVGVKRAVVTSSAAACRGPRDKPSGAAGLFDEADWNLSSRADGPGMEPYQRAKTDAELAARAAAAPGSGGPEVVAILPTCLLGPVRGGPEACAGSSSVRMFRGWLGLETAGGGGAMVQSRLVCDVRDAAAAHIAAAALDSAVIGPTRFRLTPRAAHRKTSKVRAHSRAGGSVLCAPWRIDGTPRRMLPPVSDGAPCVDLLRCGADGASGVRRRYLVGHGSRFPARDVCALLAAAAAAAGRADVRVAPADAWAPAGGGGSVGEPEMDTGRAVRELRGGQALMPACETVLAMAAAMLQNP